jgi:hypothetical protein
MVHEKQIVSPAPLVLFPGLLAACSPPLRARTGATPGSRRRRIVAAIIGSRLAMHALCCACGAPGNQPALQRVGPIPGKREAGSGSARKPGAAACAGARCRALPRFPRGAVLLRPLEPSARRLSPAGVPQCRPAGPGPAEGFPKTHVIFPSRPRGWWWSRRRLLIPLSAHGSTQERTSAAARRCNIVAVGARRRGDVTRWERACAWGCSARGRISTRWSLLLGVKGEA